MTEPAPTRDHTERMLRRVRRRSAPRRRHGRGSQGGQQLAGRADRCAGRISPPPPSSSSPAVWRRASGLTIRNVGINPTRTGLLDILRLMGADIRVQPAGAGGAEPVADIEVRRSALRGIAVPEALVPLAIDEFPVLLHRRRLRRAARRW